jgi:hypothetical protein
LYQFNVHTVHIRRIERKNQQYTLIVPLLYFYVLAPTCFGSCLPSSGSLLDPTELLENTNWGLVYHITCGYVACVPDCPATAEICRSQLVKIKEWYNQCIFFVFSSNMYCNSLLFSGYYICVRALNARLWKIFTPWEQKGNL